MTTDAIQDHELDVLTQIQADDGVKQRDIAHAIGLSLGMTNAILKRLHAAASHGPGRPVTSVILAGESDLEFVVEWCAQKEGLAFRKVAALDGDSARGEGESVFVVAAESLPLESDCDLHLARLVVEA